jgi:hypothetical protein
MKYELGRTQKEAILVYFKVLSQQLLEEAVKNHEKHQSGLPALGHD